MVTNMSKPVILTGLRANNELHLGNYLGALLPIVDMANKHAGEYQINLFVPDLHSFTTPIDHSKLQEQIISNLKLFVAAGLDLDKPDIYLYRQSYISAHSELTVILNSFTNMGEMRRMTQFKEKGGEQESASVGLFDYPVLMAADILLYGTTYVPVGDDQTQHIEFTRDIGERMNNKFGELFKLPLPVAKQHEFFGKDQGLRIRDLLDPTKKMSKSDESGRGVIFLSDSPEVAKKKIIGAATDSEGAIVFDFASQPGVSNLVQILALLTNRSPEEVVESYKNETMYGPLKEEVAGAVTKFLEEFQSKLARVDGSKLEAKLRTSEEAMNKVASEILLHVQKAVGLRT